MYLHPSRCIGVLLDYQSSNGGPYDSCKNGIGPAAAILAPTCEPQGMQEDTHCRLCPNQVRRMRAGHSHTPKMYPQLSSRILEDMALLSAAAKAQLNSPNPRVTSPSSRAETLQYPPRVLLEDGSRVVC
jgi:hypothetical protein